MERTYFLLQEPRDSRGLRVKPEEVYFYLTPKGAEIALSAPEAGRVGNFYKQIGISDGTTYLQKVKEAVDTQNAALDELGSKELPPRQHHEARQKIADAARQALKDAEVAEKDVARGNFKRPASPWGHVEISKHVKGNHAAIEAEIRSQR